MEIDGVLDPIGILGGQAPAESGSALEISDEETKLYDKSFARPVQTVSGGQIGKQWRKDVPGKIIWESSDERLAATRAKIAAAISQE